MPRWARRWCGRACAQRGGPFKAIALDCDNTLWSGICGEDGPTGIMLDDGRRALQEFMLAPERGRHAAVDGQQEQRVRRDRGVERHPEMPLQLRPFAAWRINWESKAENLVAAGEGAGSWGWTVLFSSTTMLRMR